MRSSNLLLICCGLVGAVLAANFPSPSPADEPKPAGPGITKKNLSKNEMKQLVEHIPEPFRKGISDENLVKELETVAFAFDFRGGPIDLWLEIEESGQKTMEKVFADGPVRGGWRFAAEEGHVCFAMRRGVSERVSKLATAANIKHSTKPIGIYLMYNATKTNSDKAKDNSYNSGTAREEPLWFGWKQHKTKTQQPDVKIKPGEEVTLFVVEAEETTEGVKEPRKAKVTLKAVFGEPKKP
jgi:hypothetical protein